MIEGTKLINFFSALYDQEQEAIEIKKDISSQLKGYAQNIEISPKAINAAWALYKKYKGGKNTQNDLDDYGELSGIIENYFATAITE